MPKKENTTTFSVTFPNELIASLDKYKAAKKIRSRGAMLELLLEEFMDKIQKEKLEELGRKIQ